MTKKVIAIISVLKPVDDTRNFEKVATSISNTNKYDINIIGFSTKKIPTDPNITFHPVFNFQRTSFKRLAAPYVILKNLIKLKPELIIVTCAELLPVICLYKIIFGAKIVYDIQENYKRNILYTTSYPVIFKLPLAVVVRGIEWLSRLFVDQYILAEEVYKQQLKFTKGKAVTIDNKSAKVQKLDASPPAPGQILRLVYAGTISMHYGTFDAIELTERLRSQGITAELVIIGFAADRKLRERIAEEVRGKSGIKLEGIDTLVPHEQVLGQMKKAHFCLLPYHANKSTHGRIPTKLYECLAMEKPVIITANEAWNKLIRLNNAGIIHDFTSDISDLFPLLYQRYYGKDLSHRYDWSNNESSLLGMLDRLRD